MFASDLFTQQTDLSGEEYSQLNSLLHAPASVFYWQDTYAGTNISEDFRKTLGYKCLIESIFFKVIEYIPTWHMCGR